MTIHVLYFILYVVYLETILFSRLSAFVSTLDRYVLGLSISVIISKNCTLFINLFAVGVLLVLSFNINPLLLLLKVALAFRIHRYDLNVELMKNN